VALKKVFQHGGKIGGGGEGRGEEEEGGTTLQHLKTTC